ncbi:alpha/beta hydrolase [Alcanivorax sp. JB21]|uniref:alpha/beta hydrolase n=1 Tax=Alcanivorax limicola TaxID=2874102 RepID=UPI001CBD8A84|nr:alpha/beta fold hydrolase [Alcanivorax limicola]MBZ2189130.1 alpha/beta hydrolase [Alcanivorax limicola]
MSRNHRSRPLLLTLAAVALAALIYWSAATERQGNEQDIRFSSIADITSDTGERLMWKECDQLPAMPAGTEIGCAWLGFDDEHLGEIWIPIAVFSSGNTGNTPVIYLPGGPGGSGWLEEFGLAGWQDWWQSVDANRDLIVFDPRGTGLGFPNPQCEQFREQRRAHLTAHSGPNREAADFALALTRCIKDIHAKGTDLRGFSTAAMVDDVDRIARLLQQSQGYTRYHLHGISYGSRLALQISRHAPDWLESMVLDGVYPPDRDGLTHLPRFFALMLDRIDQVCAASAWCNERFGEAGVPILALAHELRENPVTRTIRWQDGRRQQIIFSDQRLLEALAADVYTNEALPFLPLMIARFMDGEEDALDMLLWNLLAFEADSSFNRLIFSAVECQDNAFLSAAAWQAMWAAHPQHAPFISTYFDENACARMGLSPATPAWREPPVSDIPTLLVSAGLDPVTPVADAEHTAQYLSRSQHLVIANAPHGATFGHPCAHAAMRAFWAGASTPPHCDLDDLPLSASNDADALDALIRETADFWGYKPEETGPSPECRASISKNFDIDAPIP